MSPSRRARPPAAAPAERLLQLICTAIYFLTTSDPSHTNTGRVLASPLAAKSLLLEVVGHPLVTDNGKSYAQAAWEALAGAAAGAPGAE